MTPDITPRPEHRVFAGQMKDAVPKPRIDGCGKVSIHHDIPVVIQKPHEFCRIRAFPLPFHIRFAEAGIAAQYHP